MDTEMPKRKRKVKPLNSAQFQKAEENSFAEPGDFNSHANLEPQAPKDINRAEQETAGEGSVDDTSLPKPYQFLKTAAPSLHTIFFPHFTVRSLNFAVSVVLTVIFGGMLIFIYTKPQREFTWNCSLFRLQNKYYPRLRYNYELWRVLVSGLFHSNIAHFVLNLFGLQVYGYFVEWYYGKRVYGLAVIFAVVLAHFLGCLISPTSISTSGSAILFSLLGLKIVFLYEYRNYKPLKHRILFLVLLWVLIAAVNLVPIFVVNNVDAATQIGGIVSGLGIGIFLFLHKDEPTTNLKQAFKYSSLVIPSLLLIVCIALTFASDTVSLKALNDNIDAKCSQI